MPVVIWPSTSITEKKPLYALPAGVSFRVHWFGITIHTGFPECLALCREWLPALISMDGLVHKDKGGHGYTQCSEGLAGFRIYHFMREQRAPEEEGGVHCHLQLSGDSCDAVDWSTLRQFYLAVRESGYRFSVTRLDFAFDGCPFTPYDLKECIEQGKFRSYVNPDGEKSFTVYESPNALREDGKRGTITVYFGAPASDRRLRCYNKRGFTRCELECRREWAQLIALRVFNLEKADESAMQALGHLRDFADFNFPGWWSFMGANLRAHVKAKRPALIVTTSRTLDWIRSQVAPTLGALDRRMPGVVSSIVNSARPSEKLMRLLPDPYATVESVPGDYLFGLWWRAFELAQERAIRTGALVLPEGVCDDAGVTASGCVTAAESQGRLVTGDDR